jgi:hypothetical protein
MAKINVKKQFTESQSSEISRLLNTLEEFSKSEIVKLKKEYPFLITKTTYGFSLGFYKIYINQDQFTVKTQADDEMGTFSTLLQAVLFALLITKKQFALADKLLLCSTDYITSTNEVKIYEQKLSDFKKKQTKDWWQFDLYTGKLSEARNKVENAKIQLSISISDAKYIIKYIKGSSQ